MYMYQKDISPTNPEKTCCVSQYRLMQLGPFYDRTAKTFFAVPPPPPKMAIDIKIWMINLLAEVRCVIADLIHVQ